MTLQVLITVNPSNLPPPPQRDKLIATVRRNSHLAYLQMQEQSDRVKKATEDAYNNLTDAILDSWSDSQLKTFCDKNGINSVYSCFVLFFHL